MKKYSCVLLALSLLASLSACGAKQEQPNQIQVFAAASLQESLDAAIRLYERDNSSIAVIATYDSSGTLKTQIENGADCDLFVSAAPKQVNQLEELGLTAEDTRVDLLENKVVLAVPEGNPAGISGFDELAERLETADILLAMGNSDVPVGQYTQKIFAYYGLEEDTLAAAALLTYGSNVKEVTTQVCEGAVDCGIVYATDANSAGLTAVDCAADAMCGRVIYPAVILKNAPNPDGASDFLQFLTTEEAAACFAAVGFTTL